MPKFDWHHVFLWEWSLLENLVTLQQGTLGSLLGTVSPVLNSILQLTSQPAPWSDGVCCSWAHSLCSPLEVSSLSFAPGVPSWSWALFALLPDFPTTTWSPFVPWQDPLGGWEQKSTSPRVGVRKTPSFLVEGAHTGNFRSLGMALVDTEISHSCPKAVGCFKRHSCKTFWSVNHSLLYQKLLPFPLSGSPDFPVGLG